LNVIAASKGTYLSLCIEAPNKVSFDIKLALLFLHFELWQMSKQSILRSEKGQIQIISEIKLQIEFFSENRAKI